MKVFTYNQYIEYIHKVRLNAVLQLAEENAGYNLEGTNEQNRNDKAIIEILKKKKEVTNLINDFLIPREKVQAKDLQVYTNDYINKKHNSKEFQIIYKIEKKPIFYLFKYKVKIDDEINYKILNSCIDIIQSWSIVQKKEKHERYPLIVPVVIYTGKDIWKIPKHSKQKKIGTFILEKNQIDLEYNIIDINKLSAKFLLQKNSEFSQRMLIMKANSWLLIYYSLVTLKIGFFSITKESDYIDIDYRIIGERIKNLRNNKNISQEKLAKELNVPVTYICEVEKGARIELEKIAQISKVLAVPIEQIISGTVPQAPNYLNQDLYQVLIKCTPDKQKLIYNIAKIVLGAEFV